MTTELHLPAIRVEAELGARVAITLSTLAKLRQQRPSDVAAAILSRWLIEHGESAIAEASVLRDERMDAELRQLEQQLKARRPGRPRKTPTATTH